MDDNYSHVDNKIIYVTESIPGPSEESVDYRNLIQNFNLQLTHCCMCKSKCLLDSCNCISKSRGGCNYVTKKNKIVLAQYKLNDTVTLPIIECNDLCSCSMNCGNRAVQNGPVNGLYIKCCDNKGLGLFTEKYIDTGTFICEYAGEILTKAQVVKRHEHNLLTGKMNYILCLKEHSSSGTIDTFVDPSDLGNVGRYANHSCNPNCVILPVRVNSPVPKIAIFSNSDILPNTEITFHYGINKTGECTSDSICSRRICLCNSFNCSGWMPYDFY